MFNLEGGFIFLCFFVTMDTALLLINSNLSVTTTLWNQVEECEKCPLIPLIKVDPASTSIRVSTVYATTFALRDINGQQELCRFQEHLSENGTYNLDIFQNLEVGKENTVTCNLRSIDVDNSYYTPIYVFLGIVVGLILCLQVGKWLWTKYQSRLQQNTNSNQFVVTSGSEESSTTSSDEALTKTPPSRRVQSLDVFRGLTLLLMIFVNNDGGGYWFFNHAPWNGMTMADCLFPWFIFMMGVSINISMRSSAKQANISRFKLMVHILRRSCILFLLGLVINSLGYKSMAELRIPSVLGRFSVGYFVVASSQLLFLDRLKPPTSPDRCPRFLDIIPFWPIWLISIAFPFVNIMVTYLLPVPGCPVGYIGPGGLHDNASYTNCTGGAAGYIDQMWLGNAHIYQWPSCKKIYQTGAFDPEGILGYLTSTFLVFLGLQAGRIITLYSGHRDRLLRLIIWGIVLGVIAGLLCAFSKNDGWNPVNKNLWSLSFILTMASMAMLILAMLYLITDVLNIWSGVPFFYPSVNSIVIYVGSELLDNLFPFQWSMPNTHAAQLFMSLWTTVLWLGISFWLYKRKIFIAL